MGFFSKIKSIGIIFTKKIARKKDMLRSLSGSLNVKSALEIVYYERCTFYVANYMNEYTKNL